MDTEVHAPYLVIVDERSRESIEFPLHDMSWIGFETSLREAFMIASRRPDETVIRVDRVCDHCHSCSNLYMQPMSYEIAFAAVTKKRRGLRGNELMEAINDYCAERAEHYAQLAQKQIETSARAAFAFIYPATQRLIGMAIGVFKHQPDEEKN